MPTVYDRNLKFAVKSLQRFRGMTFHSLIHVRSNVLYKWSKVQVNPPSELSNTLQCRGEERRRGTIEGKD